MLRLRTFGGLSIASDEMEPAKTPARRQLALLALLAVAGPRLMSREKLFVLLWPEADTERARHSLNQTLYSLRRDFGNTLVFATGAELRLNPDTMTTDVAEFEAAIELGDAARVAAIYTGPFLGSQPDAACLAVRGECNAHRVSAMCRRCCGRCAGRRLSRRGGTYLGPDHRSL